MNRQSSLLFPLLAAICLSWSTTAVAASHREAPQIAMDPTADITDVYFFRSWEDPTKVILIMNVIPAQEPSSGPHRQPGQNQGRLRLLPPRPGKSVPGSRG